MNMRMLKIILVGFVAVLTLLFAAQNVVNLEAAKTVVGIVLSMDGQEYYADSLGPAITSPVLVWIALWTIIGMEFLAGLLSAKGVWDMWSARNATAEVFKQSKKYALLGAGCGVIVWMGFFGAIGGTYFQMWQTELGAMSLDGAFQYFVTCGFVLVFVSMAE